MLGGVGVGEGGGCRKGVRCYPVNMPLVASTGPVLAVASTVLFMCYCGSIVADSRRSFDNFNESV